MYNNVALLIGHLIGDYLFQNDGMAVNKSKPSFMGSLWCHLHCMIYAICVGLCVWLGGWRFHWQPDLSYMMAFLIAWVTHFPIDRWGLGWKWMKFFKMSEFKDIDGAVGPGEKISIPYVAVKIDKRQYFIAPVYIAVDNTLHLVLMWILLSLCGK